MHKLPAGCGLQAIFVPQGPSNGQVCFMGRHAAPDEAFPSGSLTRPGAWQWRAGNLSAFPAAHACCITQGLKCTNCPPDAAYRPFSCHKGRPAGSFSQSLLHEQLNRPPPPSLRRKPPSSGALEACAVLFWGAVFAAMAGCGHACFFLPWPHSQFRPKSRQAQRHKKIARSLHSGRFCGGQLVNQAASSGQNFNSGNRKIQPARLKGKVKVGIPNGVVRAAIAP